MGVGRDVRRKNWKGLIATLRRGRLDRRILAAVGLGTASHHANDADAALIDALQDENGLVRYAAMISLIGRDSGRDPGPLIRSLRARSGAPDPFSPSEFMNLNLFRLERIDGHAYLCRYSKDGDPIVRGHAALAMQEMGDRAAVPEVLTLLADSQGYVRKCAIEALGDFGDRRAIDPLKATAASHPEHRRMVRKALKAIGRSRA